MKIKANINELSKVTDLFKENGVYILQGDLASGKTSLVKHLLKTRLDYDDVSSPTFSILNIYEKNNKKIFHYDIYNCEVKTMLINGLFENFFINTLHLVEWGNEELILLLKKYNINATIVKITTIKEGREYEFIEA
ncbi:tRNA (adenosine(37)-N6)-threonylcarbamoyltransferase complex ATPase subunit type 1 TsaE [Campylobacter canadensis]|uniref:tRNA threonylcarbamoyladenosine biosynthesis protein TsaE n=1 Tax=Campylobacter canadensis TaxID=449520 RepID=A0ABS7WQG7_9BACT|nr:tRNA (adenosine(37)-N6)-threonylcarbamoyltransferase complex ATPase subunit type 1 TsaE [Campylobacter canadensis]MBZ7986542.1 tRNA (adenosine(37)-N6)-threonylcarbamoyltransferase complex ATPase subunit type 1 TsaE [Campylobacter canadensis]MBZ7994053.1 tRNA (adenosine(37)-N6)-threonylcarbamoyltransferase complex ATPase subunit type 1 TsaE [Campylobacter canadensis]MBZ7995944.1 tRNA (adenosine(37)-N6)-threonylcarbamoyltransferase complex ATPase subunit type 1 TsaE [Campylobacter canadensis]M